MFASRARFLIAFAKIDSMPSAQAPHRQPSERDGFYRTPSPPPSDPPEPKVPAKIRARAWFKSNVDSPWLKAALMSALMTLFVAAGLTVTAFEPITNGGVEIRFGLRLVLSALIGFVLCLFVGIILGFCYMLSEMLGDALKGIARRL